MKELNTVKADFTLTAAILMYKSRQWNQEGADSVLQIVPVDHYVQVSHRWKCNVNS